MNSLETNEKLNIPIEVSFPLEEEILRVKNAVDRYQWFVENKYRLNLPNDMREKLERGEKVTDDDIRADVENEYSDEKYREVAEEITESLKKESETFFKNLKSLGQPLPEKFHVFMSVYGVGGSHRYPDTVIVNINKRTTTKILRTVFHEMTHIAIQDLIELHNISQWTKERLVDLAMNKFFPDKPSLQRDPEHAEQISAIFEREFPNIEQIILEVSRLEIQK